MYGERLNVLTVPPTVKLPELAENVLPVEFMPIWNATAPTGTVNVPPAPISTTLDMKSGATPIGITFPEASMKAPTTTVAVGGG
jgi:hypothetical protein